MSTSPSGLTQRGERAVLALLTEPTITLAAKKAGIGEATMYRWLKENEAFQTAYRKARRLAVDQAIGLLQNVTSEAVQTLVEVMRDPLSSASARVAAARAILDTALRSVEIDDLTLRVEALETVQKVSMNGSTPAR